MAQSSCTGGIRWICLRTRWVPGSLVFVARDEKEHRQGVATADRVPSVRIIRTSSPEVESLPTLPVQAFPLHPHGFHASVRRGAKAAQIDVMRIAQQSQRVVRLQRGSLKLRPFLHCQGEQSVKPAWGWDCGKWRHVIRALTILMQGRRIMASIRNTGIHSHRTFGTDPCTYIEDASDASSAP